MMMSRTNSIGRSAAVVGALLASVAGTAWAQGERPERPPERDPALRGPAVRDHSMPGQKGRFAPGVGQPGKGRLDGLGERPRVLIQALNVLRGEKAGDDVRLTKDQDEQIRAIHREQAEAMRGYLDEHQEEIKDLRAKLSPESRARLERLLGGPGFGPGPGRPVERQGRSPKGGDGPEGRPLPPPGQMEGVEMDAPRGPKSDDPAAKERLAQLLEGAPKPKDAESKVWAVLTDAQRPLVEAELKRLREHPEPRPGTGAGQPGEGPREGLAPGQIPPGARDRLDRMPPEQREKAMKRLQERREERAKRRGAGPGEKPAPGMDEGDVPPPPPPPPAPRQPRR